MVPGQQDGLLQGHAQGAAAGPKRDRKQRLVTKRENKVEAIKLRSSTDIPDTFAGGTSSVSSPIPSVVSCQSSSRCGRRRLKAGFLSGKRTGRKQKALPDCQGPDGMERFHSAEAPDTRFLPLPSDNLSLHLCSHPR